jgi:hypothetical protein
MLGRVLFAVVCVIIATGLLLPVYPTEVAMPGTADARDMLVAGTRASACGDCDQAAASGRVACDRALQVAARKDCLHLTVYLIIRPLPLQERPGEPQLLRPRIPTI